MTLIPQLSEWSSNLLRQPHMAMQFFTHVNKGGMHL